LDICVLILGYFELTIPSEIFKLIIQIIVFCMAEKWLALSLPPFILLIYVVQKVYLRTSRQLRLLELESKAGVFSSFLESVGAIWLMKMKS